MTGPDAVRFPTRGVSTLQSPPDKISKDLPGMCRLVDHQRVPNGVDLAQVFEAGHIRHDDHPPSEFVEVAFLDLDRLELL